MHKLTANGIELNVFDEGKGSPILFVHGFPLNHTMWDDQLEHFAESHRVIAPDLRGFGQSGECAGTVSMEQFADDLNVLLDALQIREPITFCGLSMGGYVAWPFVRKYQDRLKSLILCDTRAGADSPEGAQTRIQLAKTVLQLGPEPMLESMLPNLFAQKTFDEAPKVIEKIQQMIATTKPAAIAAALHGMADRPDSMGLLAEIRVPTLVLVGEEDVLSTPDEMGRMAAAIPRCEFVEIPRAGHLSPMENPDAVNTAIESFLNLLE